MQFSKSTLLSFLGLLVLIFFIIMAYVNNHVFLDKLLICSFILAFVLFVKMKGESNGIDSNSDNTKYTDFS